MGGDPYASTHAKPTWEKFSLVSPYTRQHCYTPVDTTGYVATNEEEQMKITIELELTPYITQNEESNEIFSRAVYLANASAAKLAEELPMPATVDLVRVQR